MDIDVSASAKTAASRVGLALGMLAALAQPASAAVTQRVMRVAGTSVEYKIDRELEFFRARQALYMELSDLNRVRDYIGERIEYERALYNPLNIFGGEELQEPKLDFDRLRSKYAGRMSA